ncbi:MAG TPA: DUF6624 domain-containing protein [Acidimicrobiales bacterium]|nr:DUF6624 domain-containing protein [Acidimicrobiales bacterium]
MLQRRVAIVAVVVVVAATLALLVRPPLKKPGLSHELIAMQREIDEVNVNFGSAGGRFSISDLPEALRDRLAEARDIDLENMNRLRPLLERYGWPSEKQVGREALHAAITVVQRAPEVAFKEFAIGLMKRARADDSADYARLVDIVAVTKGEPQTYGTQWTCEDGTAKPVTPVKDPARVQELRRQVGLDQYDKFAVDLCYRGIEGEPPPPA